MLEEFNSGRNYLLNKDVSSCPWTVHYMIDAEECHGSGNNHHNELSCLACIYLPKA